MKEHTLHIQYQVAQLEELPTDEQLLVKKAKEATRNSYANYSHFHVGAACLLADGRIIGSLRRAQRHLRRSEQLSRASHHHSCHRCMQ